LHPKYGPGAFARFYGSIAAKQLFQALPELRKEQRGGELWRDGEYVATVDVQGDWSVVERFIKQHGEDPEEVQLRMF